VDPPPNPSRGWHPDPQDGSRLRYWTGDSWTEKTRSWSAMPGWRPSPPPSDVTVKPKRIWPMLLGALVVLALFFVAPVLGLLALVVLLVLALSQGR
jgi:hypothetical protein